MEGIPRLNHNATLGIKSEKKNLGNVEGKITAKIGDFPNHYYIYHCW